MQQQALSMGQFTDQKTAEMQKWRRSYQYLYTTFPKTIEKANEEILGDIPPEQEEKWMPRSHVAGFITSTYDTRGNCRCGLMKKPQGPYGSFNMPSSKLNGRKEDDDQTSPVSVPNFPEGVPRYNRVSK